MIEQLNQKMNNAINHLDKEFNTIRTSRANPSMLDNVFADAYGSKTPINQLGNISTPDPSTLTIQVWDTSVIKNIENSILDSGKVSYYSKSLSNIKIYSSLRRILNQLVIEQRLLNQKIDVALVSNLSKKIEFETFELDDFGDASETDSLSSFFGPYIFLMILFGTIFMSGQLLLRSVMEERTSRTIEILLCSVTPDELMRGKILGLGALGTVQMFFYLIVAILITNYKGLTMIEYSQIPFFLIYFVILHKLVLGRAFQQFYLLVFQHEIKL